MSDQDQSPHREEVPKSEHLNIKVTDNNNEVFFKIKRTTQLSKLMNAFCERQGKTLAPVRFLFDGARVQPSDSPESVSPAPLSLSMICESSYVAYCSLQACHRTLYRQLSLSTSKRRGNPPFPLKRPTLATLCAHTSVLDY